MDPKNGVYKYYFFAPTIEVQSCLISLVFNRIKAKTNRVKIAPTKEHWTTILSITPDGVDSTFNLNDVLLHWTSSPQLHHVSPNLLGVAFSPL